MGPAEEAGRGGLVVVLGPSGAGKDTVLSGAARLLGDRPDICFIRRSITREAHDHSEVFEPLSPEAFERAVDAGRFCFYWAANGLRYGLPASMKGHLAGGGWAVVNGSRAALPQMRKRFDKVLAVELRVARAVLEERLRLRGRESRAEIAARLDRADTYRQGLQPDLVIDNSGSADDAAAQLADFLRSRATFAAGAAF